MKAKLIIDGKEVEIEISEEEAKVLMGKKPKTGYERVEIGDLYFLICEFGDVRKSREDDDYYDNNRHAEANYYSDETVAKNNARADRLYRQLRRFAVEHRETAIDWKDKNQAKFVIGFGNDTDFTVGTAFYLRGFGGIYFDSEEACELAIDTFRDELIWYFSGYQDSL